jgi:hypothetical protein
VPVVVYEEGIPVDPDAYYPVCPEELMMDRQRTSNTSAAHIAEGFLPTGFVSTLFDSNQARRYTFSVPARGFSTAHGQMAQTDKLTFHPIVKCHEELHVRQVE